MNITNQKDEQRKRIHKAANIIAEYQTAWKEFYAKPSHKIAREVITKGESSLDQQNTTGFLCLTQTQFATAFLRLNIGLKRRLNQ